MNEVLTADTTVREQAFKERKETGDNMVHRLRDWEEGDILWGYESISESASTGKTYSRRDRQNRMDTKEEKDLDTLSIDDAHEAARNGYESCVDPKQMSMGGGLGSAVFLYAARIGSTRQEPRSPTDPGEPPLQFANLEKVAVFDSEYIPPEDADE